MSVIDEMENSEEIRYEYEKTLSLAGAVSVVKERKAAIKREKSEKQSLSENSAQNRDQAHPGAVAANPTGGTPGAQARSESQWTSFSQNPTGGTPAEANDDTFFDELFASMDGGVPPQEFGGNVVHWNSIAVGGTPVFELPKRTYTLRFQLTDDEWRTLLSRINGLEYEVVRNED